MTIVVSSTDLYTETDDAPAQETSSAPSRDAAPVECIDLLNSSH